jgi:hypothetical protein
MQSVIMATTMAALHPSNPYYSVTPQNSNNHDAPINTLTNSQHPPSARRHPPRSASIATASPSQVPVASVSTPHQRKRSVDYQRSTATTYRTRSIGGPFGGGVYFERQIDTSPPNDDEIIIATVRVTNSFRRASIEENSELPARPPKRNFIRRVSTRVSSPADQCRYTALKMPRKDYKKYFARDRDGNYAGTEPEKEWSEAELQIRFGEFQDMLLRTIPGGQEFGEGSHAISSANTAAERGEESWWAGADSAGEVGSGGLTQMQTWSGFDNDAGGRRTSLI